MELRAPHEDHKLVEGVSNGVDRHVAMLMCVCLLGRVAAMDVVRGGKLLCKGWAVPMSADGKPAVTSFAGHQLSSHVQCVHVDPDSLTAAGRKHGKHNGTLDDHAKMTTEAKQIAFLHPFKKGCVFKQKKSDPSSSTTTTTTTNNNNNNKNKK